MSSRICRLFGMARILAMAVRRRLALTDSSPSLAGRTLSAALLNSANQNVVAGALARTATMSAPGGAAAADRSFYWLVVSNYLEFRQEIVRSSGSSWSAPRDFIVE